MPGAGGEETGQVAGRIEPGTNVSLVSNVTARPNLGIFVCEASSARLFLSITINASYDRGRGSQEHQGLWVFADLQISKSPIGPKKNLERHYNLVVVCLFVWLAATLITASSHFNFLCNIWVLSIF